LGGGVGYYLVKLTGEVSGVTDSVSESDFGFHILAGYSFGDNFFGETKFSSADVEGVNAGGIS